MTEVYYPLGVFIVNQALSLRSQGLRCFRTASSSPPSSFARTIVQYRMEVQMKLFPFCSAPFYLQTYNFEEEKKVFTTDKSIKLFPVK